MADLPSGPIIKINDLETSQDSPMTQSLMVKIGQDINALIDRTFFYQEFLTTATFTVPTGIERLWAYGCGGGGGGASGSQSLVTSPSTYKILGGPGGAGANPTWHLIDVVPEVTYTITIGAGGAGGVSGNGPVYGSNSGQRGSTSSFGTLAYFSGGAGGQTKVTSAGTTFVQYPGMTAGSCTASAGGFGSYDNTGLGGEEIIGTSGERGILGIGGTLGTGDSGGGGGGGSIGAGGNGGNLNVDGAAGGRGAGGGGGGGYNIFGGIVTAGGTGGPGYMMLVWF